MSLSVCALAGKAKMKAKRPSRHMAGTLARRCQLDGLTQREAERQTLRQSSGESDRGSPLDTWLDLLKLNVSGLSRRHTSLGCLVAVYCEASSSSDVPLPAPMARNAFAVRPLVPPAFAIGTQPRPTRCEYLGCSRVEQADRTPTLRVGNLHRIPSRTAPIQGGAFRRPNRQPPTATELDCLADAPAMGPSGVHKNV